MQFECLYGIPVSEGYLSERFAANSFGAECRNSGSLFVNPMSFSFAKVKNFASRVKDSVTSNVNTIVQNNPGLSRAGATLRESISDVVSSVKSTSAALGKQISQTAENFAAKANATVTVTIRGSEVRYVIDNMGRMGFPLWRVHR